MLGRYAIITVKRDGSNISLWLDDTGEVRISSHNMEKADEDLTNRMRAVPEFEKAVELLRTEKAQFGKDLILYGELVPAGYGATRIERKKKKASWILFDIWDSEAGRFVGYNNLFQYGYHYKIPVVGAVGTFVPDSMETLQKTMADALKWCRRHSREGIVIKAYDDPQTMAKEKRDLPKLKKLPTAESTKVHYPPMPEERIQRALIHAFDAVGEANWPDKSKSMPEIARQITTEAREHFFEPPRNMYQLYLETPVEKLKAKVGNAHAPS